MRGLKALLKQVIGEEHWLYLSWYRNHFGALRAIAAYARMQRRSRLASAPNLLDGGRVFLRPGTSDLNVYDEVFIGREYELDLGRPLVIVDAGAHVGLAATYFASRYPEALVIALEPEPENFRVLQFNARSYANIKPVNVGIWGRPAHLRIDNPSDSTWSFRVSEDTSGRGIPAVGVADIAAEHGLQRIDVLKLDVEGSEIEVLNSSELWLNRVGTIIIELHDRFRPGCRQALEAALQDYDYQRTSSGESVVIRAIQRRQTSA
jgi:FkbM family methyltransferase